MYTFTPTEALGYLPAFADVVSEGKWLLYPHLLPVVDALEDVMAGRKRRVAIFMPPRHGKSESTSKMFPACIVARNPEKRVIIAGYGKDFASQWGLKTRNIMTHYGPLFGTSLDPSSKAKDHWKTMEGGGVHCCGVGSAVTGLGCDTLILDDPLRGYEEAHSPVIRENTWNWVSADLMTRLEPGGSVVLVMCMTGDTAVTMADGTYRRLDEIRPGMEVLSYKDGTAVFRKVANWTSQGMDQVLEIKTGSSTVRCNARHPFLVQKQSGKRSWVRAGELKKGDRLVASSRIEFGATPRLTMDEAWLLGFMFGDGWLTHRIAKNYDKKRNKHYPRRGIVTCAAFSKNDAQDAEFERRFNSLFGFIPKRTKFGYWRTERQNVGRWFSSRGLTGNAKTKRVPEWMFAQPLQVREQFLEGYNHADGCIVTAGATRARWCHVSVSESLIRDIRQLARSCGCRVTNVHCRSMVAQAPNSPVPIETSSAHVAWSGWNKNNSEFTAHSTIRSIIPVGVEEVFDIQVEDAECFVADGLVVHNTRWHEDDVAARMLQHARDTGEEWHVVNMPAIAETDEDWGEFQRKMGDALCPQRYPIEDLRRIEREIGPYKFGCLYQQRPTTPEGNFWPAALFENVMVSGSPAHVDFPVIAVDPSMGKERKDKVLGDYAAVVGLAHSPTHRRFYCDPIIERMRPEKITRAIAEIYHRMPNKPRAIGVEAVGFQSVLEQRFREDLPNFGVFCPVIPLEAHIRHGKELRIKELDSWIANRMILFQDSEGGRRMVSQLKNFPLGYDDGPDALRMAFDVMASLE